MFLLREKSVYLNQFKNDYKGVLDKKVKIIIMNIQIGKKSDLI